MYDQHSILKSRDITLPTKVRLVRAVIFSSSHVWMWELDYKESWVPKNLCFWTVVLEKTLDSPLDCKEMQAVHPKGDQSWLFIGRTDAEVETPNTLATWCEEWTHLKKPWCWERLKAGEGDDRGLNGWMASPIQWTWAWVNSGSWWWTGKPGMMQSMGLQRVRHDWVTELNRTDTPRIGAPQYIRQTLTDIEGEAACNTIVGGDSNTPLTPTHRSSQQNY